MQLDQLFTASECPVAAGIECWNLHPFTISNFHSLITMKLVTSKALLHPWQIRSSTRATFTSILVALGLFRSLLQSLTSLTLTVPSLTPLSIATVNADKCNMCRPQIPNHTIHFFPILLLLHINLSHKQHLSDRLPCHLLHITPSKIVTCHQNIKCSTDKKIVG